MGILKNLSTGAYDIFLSNVIRKDEFELMRLYLAWHFRSIIDGEANPEEVKKVRKHLRSFRKYLDKQKEEETIGNLKKDLDDCSKSTVDEAISFIKRINRLEEDKISLKKFYNYKNISAIPKMLIEFWKLKKKYKMPEYIILSGESLYFHHGLRFIDKNIIKRTIEGRDIIDCGACLGDSAIAFCAYYNPRQVICFEPDEKNYEKLKETIEVCNLGKVKAEKMAVGEKQLEARLERKEGYPPESKICHETKIGEKVLMTDIDSYVKANNLKVGTIKMDIEGYEMKAFEGAIETIKKHRPILLISIYHSSEDFFELKTKIISQVKEYKFRLKQLSFKGIDEMYLVAYPVV